MLRAMDKWLAGYLVSVLKRPRRGDGPPHVMFCVADHFEPFRGGVSAQAARTRVREWVAAYPEAVRGLRDADGRAPQHTCFYPAEEADPDCLAQLAGWSRAGGGEVEIHLHHRADTPEGFREKLETFRNQLHIDYGLLGRDMEGRVRYGFVHGNWALCNGLPDGGHCGVNEELGILLQTGCYADFTFPAAPSPAQSRCVNGIFRATDRPGRARGHDDGRRVSTQRAPGTDALMLITGPLGVDWHRRKLGILPRLENAEISGMNPPVPARIRNWMRQGIHVEGCPEWIFVKVHTHSCVQDNREMLMGPAMRAAHAYLTEDRSAGREHFLHYVTAREMYNIARAAENGCRGNPGDFRDYEIQGARGQE